MTTVDEDEYEYEVEWDEWIPDLLKSIGSGGLDTYLSDIVRACYSRRDPKSVLPNNVVALLQNSLDPDRTVLRALPGSLEDAKRLGYSDPLYIQVGSVQHESGGSHPSHFTFSADDETEQYWYPKEKFVGRFIELAPGHLPMKGVHWGAGSIPVRIIEINQTRFNFRFGMVPDRAPSRIMHQIKMFQAFAADRALLRRYTNRSEL